MGFALHFRLADGQGREQIDALLARKYTFVVEGSVAEEWTFYDTFDWRLFQKALVIYQCGRELVLHPIAKGEDRRILIGSSSPLFVRDLPEGPLREQLQPVIEERALLNLAQVHIQSTTYRMWDRDEKTVARLVYTETRLSPNIKAPALTAYLSLWPVRGYRKATQKFASDLIQGEAIVPPHATSVITSLVDEIYLSVLKATGHRPGAYTGKLDIRLKADMRSDEATRTIMLHLLAAMRANEDGIKKDIDTEFLHDYRVAIRRTRSALSQIKNVFPEEVTERFKGEFRLLGSRTNHLRDLDVYLLAEPAYRAMLPDVLQDDVVSLFDYLRSQRADALRDVTEGLDSEEYVRVLQEWESFLTAPIAESIAGANAAVPVIDLARQRIGRTHRRIVKEGNQLLGHTEDEQLHALRIECKKLRYLLEFFAGLFPPKKVGFLIRQLKQLQDNLGEFTDLTVQQASLLDIAGQLPIDDPQTRRALVAIGALVESLARRQQDVKGQFAETFSSFASSANQKAYRKLFGGKSGKLPK